MCLKPQSPEASFSMLKKKKNFFVLTIVSVLLFVVAIFAGGFVFLDKVIIPKYFAVYKINNTSDLFGVISSLYSSPDEDDLVLNGFEDSDLNLGVGKLQAAGYKIENDGTVKSENLAEFKGTGKLLLTEKEFSAVCDKFLSVGIFENSLKNLSYFNLKNIEIIDFVITPLNGSFDENTNSYTKLNLNFDIKVETVDLKKQISIQMQTPDALIKIIIPDELYFSLDYEVDLTSGNIEQKNNKISINGKSIEDSETLINLLIEFIYPKEDEMNLEKFSKEIGNIPLIALDFLGKFKVVKDNGTNKLEIYNI